MNVLILAAGEKQPASGSPVYPTWLSEIEGTLLLERQVKALQAAESARFIFLFRHEDVETYYLNDIIGQIAPGSVTIGLRGETAGAACTALLAIGDIDMDAELVVASATDQIDVDFAAVIAGFRNQGADAGILTFPSLHPRYSYVRIDAEGWVVESSEKRPISRSASTGLYWFRKASDFFDGAKEMILKDAHVQNKFFICPILNELILCQKKIGVYRLTTDQYHPLKSDKQVDHLESLLEEGATA
ncbi:glycosyltransferase family 2 protein [Methylobacterium sp. J-068]|uniref:glycosyltransferase family 2 protein n=1 Tax=Methylobacterium sp. J-068 TaxID=2836649 RepID=UPI001FB9AB9E|nr:glycosyltransferase family 2 protein [Methylobacterium sp. J-068]MCJ2033218.1 glycosyltransferase family 2 protein [Methylobacterium sp. J-068]